MWPDEPTLSSDSGPRRRWWHGTRFAAVIAFVMAVVLGGSVLVASRIEIDYLALEPGPATDIADLVTVTGTEATGEDGELYFLTVVMHEVTALDWLLARFDDEVEVAPRDRLQPPGMSDEDRRLRGRTQIDQSKQTALFVALDRLGYEATVHGDGAVLTALVDGGPAGAAGLAVGDVILGLGDAAVFVAEDLVGALADAMPGDTVDLLVASGEDDEPRAVRVVLASHPDDAERGFLGVSLGTVGLRVDAPFQVEIDTDGVGGPSAGMMFTIAIVDHLTPADMTRGHRIAGTGTIAPDGSVGPVGGVHQKTFAAIDAGAEYLLVPEPNADEARGAAGDDITVVEVATIDDALAFLDGLPPIFTG